MPTQSYSFTLVNPTEAELAAFRAFAEGAGKAVERDAGSDEDRFLLQHLRPLDAAKLAEAMRPLLREETGLTMSTMVWMQS